jgi:hypothetical protein
MGGSFKKLRMKGRYVLGSCCVLVLVLTGCATRSAYWQEAPRLAEGQGRVWFYRTGKFWGRMNHPVMHVGSVVAGDVEQGRAFYVDVPAGNYLVECTGMGWGKCDLSVSAGETKYVRVKSSVRAGFEPIGLKEFVIEQVDSGTGLAGLKRCKLRTNG